MAIFHFKTTLEHADSMCRHERLFDMRGKEKHVKVGDIIMYEPCYNGKIVQNHSIHGRKFGVIYVDGDDPRVMKDLDIFQMVELEPDFV